MKIFYGVIKKMLDKADEEKIAPQVDVSVLQAKFANKSSKIFRMLYNVYDQFTNDGGVMTNVHVNITNARVSMKDFVGFLKFYHKEFSEVGCKDIYMNL